jgi:hypothetical protein
VSKKFRGGNFGVRDLSLVVKSDRGVEVNCAGV